MPFHTPIWIVKVLFVQHLMLWYRTGYTSSTVHTSPAIVAFSSFLVERTVCYASQVLEEPSTSGNQADLDRATDALFGNVLQGPPSLTPPNQPSAPTGTGVECLTALCELMVAWN